MVTADTLGSRWVGVARVLPDAWALRLYAPVGSAPATVTPASVLPATTGVCAAHGQPVANATEVTDIGPIGHAMPLHF
jgi:hypothetical protein